MKTTATYTKSDILPSKRIISADNIGTLWQVGDDTSLVDIVMLCQVEPASFEPASFEPASYKFISVYGDLANHRRDKRYLLGDKIPDNFSPFFGSVTITQTEK